jgi:TetR/AcrR family transcriptional regulator
MPFPAAPGWRSLETSVDVVETPSTRELILDVALDRFGERGYDRTSLNEIADEVGIRRSSLLHHFPSKEALYRAVALRSFADWFTLVDDAVSDPGEGWPRVEKVLLVALRFFAQHPQFVRLASREAAEGRPIFWEELASGLRPLFDRAVRFLDGEMDAGRLCRYDARQLIFSIYGAILSYFSDGPLVEALVGEDPLGEELFQQRCRHVIDLFRNALLPR